MKISRPLAVFAVLILAATASLPLVAQVTKDLVVYFIDVEGGQATLFVAPTGESVLVDTGWPGDRDASRIAAAAKLAGLTKIDNVLITHFHVDHVGGAPTLVTKIPVTNFFDHGETVEPAASDRKLYTDYVKIAEKAHRTIVKPGDKLPLKGIDWTIVSAAGKSITNPLPGAGKKNPACADFKPMDADATENAQSDGSIVQFGKFRLADLGDLTWNKEGDLVCPANKLGTVDVFVVSHHGLNISNSPTLVNALHPRVAIMDNGARKGGTPQAWTVLHQSPGIEDLWQLHFAIAGGADHNSAADLIANPVESPDSAFYIELIAHNDGHFDVVNARNNFSKKY